MELTPFDYQILDFINKHEPIKKDDILKRFSSEIDTIEYRLGNLSKPIFAGPGRPNLPNYIKEEFDCRSDEIGGQIITWKGIYHLSNIGKKALQDYKLEKQIEHTKNMKDTILKILPIVISGLSLLLSCYAIFVASKH